ncbi:MAG: DNA polymerase III subunit alpha, partial [Rhodospirillaceae bacterium]|nr:DNA polymerase III subunit alpha [Rhodospirillaceae bacterium]
QIITFGKLQARAVLRDVGRVLQMPYPQVDRICKLVPNNPAAPVSLPEAITAEPQLREMIREENEVRHLVEIAKRLEGLYRHASTHAAGVVIGDRPLSDLVPLYRDPRSDMPVTGFNMKYVEQAGLVKYDFLGLKTLTVLAKAVDHVAQSGVEVDLLAIPLDDAKTFEMFGRAETQGVFQLESAGMKEVLRSLRADKFEDIIAVVALYRPGPMENIPSYIARKHGEEEPDYLYPTLEPILKETFGIMIYQEQVMQIAQELSGFSLGGADLLRRAMGKKIQSEMDEQRSSFVDGAKARGVPEAKAGEIFDQVNKFAGYGFNKSHAAAYAMVAYQTGYMKANFPVEFMAASMTLDMGNTDKLNAYRQELDRLGIDLLPPDINASDVTFKVERDADGKAVSIRYALAAIKNVGEGAMEGLIAERTENGPFKDITDFANRVDAHQVNKRQMDNLVRSGAFDCLVANRRQMFSGLEMVLGTAQAAQSERESGQTSLFGGDDASAPAIRMPDIADWSLMDKLKEEFDALGFYLSAHPLDSYAKSLKRLDAQRYSDILALGRSGAVSIAGTVISKKERISAKGNRYAFVQFSDTTGAFEAIVFSEQLAQAGDMLEPGQSLFMRAGATFEGETLKLAAQSLKPLDEVASQTAAGLMVTLDNDKPLEPLKAALDACSQGKGKISVLVRTPPTRDVAGQEIKVGLQREVRVTPELLQAVRRIPGIAEVQEI